MLTKNIITDHHMMQGHLQIACKGLSALWQAQSNQPMDPAAPHYDLIGAIQQLHKTIPLHLTFEHVKGHQDLGTTMVLPWPAWMNIEMNLLAKATIDSSATGPHMYQIDGKPWVCYISGQSQRQIKQVSTILCTHINTIMIKEHWDKKHRYKKGHATMIDFKSTGQAICRSPKAQQRWVAKMAAQFLPYGTNMCRWKLR